MAAPRPNTELTTAEKDTLRAYREYESAHGAAPGLRTLARILGVTHNAVRYTFRKLREKGYLTQKRTTAVRLVLSLSDKGRKVAL